MELQSHTNQVVLQLPVVGAVCMWLVAAMFETWT
jgi:hypothetical protein